MAEMMTRCARVRAQLPVRARARVRTPGLLLVVALAAASPALAVNIPVNVRVGGTNPLTIGTIDAQSGGSASDNLRARFNFDAEFSYLDDWYDFQWLNVVTRVVGNPSPLFPAGAPAIDPLPFQPGEDNNPCYYNMAEWASGMFGGQSIRLDGSYSLFSDNPQRAPGDGFDFTTFLVVKSITDPLINANTICVLTSFNWEYRGTGDVSTMGMEVPVNLATINGAMANTNAQTGMFGAFMFDANCSLTACPTPGTATMVGLIGLFGARRCRR